MKIFDKLINRTNKVQEIEDGNMVHSLERRGPAIWKTLHSENFGQTESGESIKLLPMPKAVRLAHYGFQNRIAYIFESVKTKGLTGDTLFVYTPKEIYAVDHPNDELVAQLEVNDKATLERIALELKAKLSSKEESGVIYSSDGMIRQTRREGVNIVEGISLRDLSYHRGVALLSGNLENAGLLAQIAGNKKHFNRNPRFSTHPKTLNIDYSVNVVGLCSSHPYIHGNYKFVIVGSSWNSDRYLTFGFGGFESGGADPPKKWRVSNN